MTGPLDAIVSATERVHLANALSQCGGERKATARALGIPRSRLYRMLATHADIAAEYPPTHRGRPVGVTEAGQRAKTAPAKKKKRRA